MLTPKVSIVIPCYNHGEFLPETLASVAAQTFSDFEIVVVNDGSTDEPTIKLLERLEQPQLRVIHTPNKGVSAARNRGIKEAVGRIILPLDADDLIAPEYLAMTVPILETCPGVGVVFCERQLFGERQGQELLPAYDPRRLLVENLIYPAALFRKVDWAAVGGYNEAMIQGWEDWDFWIALSQLGGTVVKIPEALFWYRVRSTSRDHSLSFTEKLNMYRKMVQRNWKVYRRHWSFVVLTLYRMHLSKRLGCGAKISAHRGGF